MNSVNIFTQDSTWGIGTCPSIFVDPQILPVELSVMLLDIDDGQVKSSQVKSTLFLT